MIGIKTKTDKRVNIWAVGFAALLLVVSIGIATAHGFGRGTYNTYAEDNQAVLKQGRGGMGCMGMMESDDSGMCPFHERMEEILEEGTYEDLEAHREKVGFNIMPWVQSQADFEKAKEMHEQMEESGLEGNGRGMMRGTHRRGGCPIMG